MSFYIFFKSIFYLLYSIWHTWLLLDDLHVIFEYLIMDFYDNWYPSNILAINKFYRVKEIVRLIFKLHNYITDEITFNIHLSLNFFRWSLYTDYVVFMYDIYKIKVTSVIVKYTMFDKWNICVYVFI